MLIDNFRLVERGRFREAELMRAAHRPPLARAATSRRTSPTSRRRSPPTRRACTSSARWSSISGSTWCAPTWATSRTTPPRACAASSTRCTIPRSQVDDRPGRRHPGEDHRRPREARGDGRLHRHLARAEDQLQRAGAGDPRGRALRLPRHGRGRHPDERRLPPPDPHRHPGRLDAVAALPGGRRRRQRRDQPARHRLPVRRARRAGLGAGHDEQPHLRQRPLPVLRDDLLRRAGRRLQRRHRLRRRRRASTPT